MNIFFLDSNPKIAATYHNDKHVVKMIVESFQMLSTNCRLHGCENEFLYKKCFENHPCTIWGRQSIQNFEWLLKLNFALCEEYTNRYNKLHSTFFRLFKLKKEIEYVNFKFPQTKFTTPALAMPKDCILKVEKFNSEFEYVIQNYRNYYLTHKSYLKKYTNRQIPDWYE